MTMPHPPARAATALEDLVPLGDSRTAVLLSTAGVVEWGCDTLGGTAHFARLLGGPEHGHWALAPTGASRATSSNWDGDALVLVQEWDTADGGRVRVTSFMPPQPQGSTVSRLHQIVEGLAGTVPMTSHYAPMFEYGRLPGHAQRLRRPNGAEALRLSAGPVALLLDGPRHTPADVGPGWAAQFTVTAGQRATLTLTIGGSRAATSPAPVPDVDLLATRRDWTAWSSRLTYQGPYREAVLRAAALLRLLTVRDSGAVAAAVTTSVPEWIGGARNWDYRFCWLRDSALTVEALVRCGFLEEAARWRQWLLRAAGGDLDQLAIMYTLDGGRDLTERELPWLPGYAGSSPVRTGNGAAGQAQHDVLGELVQALVACERAGLPADPDVDRLMAGLGERICAVWSLEDAGIWEVRGPLRHFTHSKVLCWQGLDLLVGWAAGRAAAGAEVVEGAVVARWTAVREEIRESVCRHGYSEESGAFTQYYGGRDLDAAVLLMASCGILDRDDKRLLSTVDAVVRDLADANGFVRRYQPRPDGAVDGLTDDEGAFVACSFHAVEALAAVGHTHEARALFERLLDLRTPHGVLSEMWDADRQRLTGNLPQGFSLWALISAALALDPPSPGPLARIPHSRRPVDAEAAA
ncbi:glycoside hydrolase family 15 protein [Kitasatospora sp. NPDC056783]|uniref:glycoside hydrolase family 15 protein n=1 Tax=Kitasatospora sp. NPDC056783 TaxID=3345943 RepID=UPI0036B8C231